MPAYHAVLEGGGRLAAEEQTAEGGVVGVGAGGGRGRGLEDAAEEVRVRGHGGGGGALRGGGVGGGGHPLRLADRVARRSRGERSGMRRGGLELWISVVRAVSWQECLGPVWLPVARVAQRKNLQCMNA